MLNFLFNPWSKQVKKLRLIFIFLFSVCCAKDNLELLISPQEISQKIKEVAAQINEEYRGKDLVIIMVMKGAICIGADLIRELDIPCTIECVKASSYGQNGTKRGELVISGVEKVDLSSKHVLIVDDIFDTGNTMTNIIKRLQEKEPKSVKTLVLLSKKIHRDVVYTPDFSLFEINNRFVVGYGLDYKEYYRGLPGIYAFINDIPPEDL